MQHFRRYLPLAALLVGAAVLGMPAAADASFLLKLSDGTTTVTVADGAANDSNGTVGVPDGAITFIGAIGNWTINVSTGISKPNGSNGPFEAFMDLNSVNTTNANGGTLTIMLTDTDFAVAGDGLQVKSEIGGTVKSGTGNSLTAQQVIDLENQEFATTGAVVLNHGPFGAGAFSDTEHGETPAYNAGDKFSITETVVITHVGAGTTSFDMTSTVTTPAPAAILLAVSGLPVLLGGWWARRRRVATAAA